MHTYIHKHSFRFSLELADNDAFTLEAAERGDVTLQKRFRVSDKQAVFEKGLFVQ